MPLKYKRFDGQSFWGDQMGKIDELEQKIIANGMTDEDFAEYEKLLKRVRGNYSKRQHCYTTAIQFSKEYTEQAIRLIQYGLDTFEDDWFSTYRSYLYMGHIYEGAGNYEKALESYLLAKDALGSDHTEYAEELSKELFWMKLHVDSFGYSNELEEYVLLYKKTSGFSQSLMNSEFRTALAEIVIFLHHGKINEAKEATERAKRICHPNYKGDLQDLLFKHYYRESLNTTPESISFIENVKI